MAWFHRAANNDKGVYWVPALPSLRRQDRKPRADTASGKEGAWRWSPVVQLGCGPGEWSQPKAPWRWWSSPEDTRNCAAERVQFKCYYFRSMKSNTNPQRVVNGGWQNVRLLCREKCLCQGQKNDCVEDGGACGNSPPSPYPCVCWESRDVKIVFAVYRRVLRLMCLDRLWE